MTSCRDYITSSRCEYSLWFQLTKFVLLVQKVFQSDFTTGTFIGIVECYFNILGLFRLLTPVLALSNSDLHRENGISE